MVILSNLRVQRITYIFLGLVVLLTFISFTLGAIVVTQNINSGMMEKLFKLFNVDFERNIPTWFSSTALAFAGMQFLMVAYYRHALNKNNVFHWLGLGLIFMAISLDEFGQLHEQSITPLRESFDTSGFLYYPWIIPAALLTIVVGGFYFRFIQELRWETKAVFIAAGLLYVVGALGIEAVGGYYFDNYVRPFPQEYDLIYLFLTHIEEFCEMLGIALFLHVGLRYVQMMALSKLGDVENDES